MKRHLKLLPFLILLLLFIPTPSLASPSKVIRVVDGDTIVVDYKGKSEKVRLLRVNTPESVHPDKKQNIPMGKVASDYTKNRLHGKLVNLQFEGELRDRYNRLLAYVFIDGMNFNVELVEQGLSPYYTQYGKSKKYDKTFRSAEKQARNNNLGIWSDPELTDKYLRLKSKWGQSASTEKPPTPTQSGLAYHGNLKSKKFHQSSCQYFDCKNCTAIFHSRDEAIAAGYVSCEICNP
ncbi:thermonuclease family protein [Thermodesulfobacteriota bacterium]